MKKSREEVSAGMQEILREVFSRDDIQVRDDMTAKDVKEWDSINHINVVVAAEQRFGVALTVREVARLSNVGQFIDLILSKLG